MSEKIVLRPVGNGGNCADALDDMPLAMAYVPMQKWRDIYDDDVALSRGTIFAELDLPFLGRRAIEE